jgi:hypothetical protein
VKSFLYSIINLCYIFPFHSFGVSEMQIFKGETTDPTSYYFKVIQLWGYFPTLNEEIIREKRYFESHREDLLRERDTLITTGASADDSSLEKLKKEVSKKLTVVAGCIEVLGHLMSSAKDCQSFADDIWIVSAIRKRDGEALMRMCVVSDKDSKITHHIGICQTYEHFIGGEERPKGLSLQLHGFAARFMLERKSDRTFMVTKPLPVMERILQEAFGRDYFEVSHKIGSTARGGKFSYLVVCDGIPSKISLREFGERWLQSLHIYTRALRLRAMAEKLENVTSIIEVG